jgi:large subunit ribosomal protein L25
MSKVDFVVTAESRSDMGKGASRRLRREGKIPGIIYGAHKDATPVLLDHNEMMNHLKHEAFYSHVLTIKLDGKTEQAVLKDLQRHPAKPVLLHADFQRVSASEKLRMHVPLHFVGGDVAPGVKVGGGMITHNLTEVEISCLPKDLPEFIEVDLSGMELGASLHLSEIKLPKGVELTALTHGSDLPVAAIHASRTAAAEEGAAAEGEEAAG